MLSGRILIALVTGAFVTGGAVIALSQDVQAASLQDAVATAIETNPEVSAIRSNRRAIDQELEAARGLYYPSIDITGSAGYEVTDPAGPLGSIDLMPKQVGATFTQLLFDGFGRESEIDRQQGRVRSASYRVFDTIEAVALRAVESYLDVLRTTEVVNIAEGNVARHDELLDLVTRRAESGAGPRSDIDQAAARLGAARAALAAVEGRRDDAIANYIANVGVPPEDLQTISVPADALPPTVDEAVDTAVANSPVVRVAEAEIDRAKGEVGVAESNFWPRVDLRAAANREEDVDGIVGTSTDYSVQAVMTYNIFRGGIDTARLQESKERLQQSQDELGVAHRDVAEETRLAWNGLMASRKSLEALTLQASSNERVRDAYFQQFEVNRRSLLDLLDVENELFVSRSNVVSERYTSAFGVYRVLATMGMLTETLAVARPGESGTLQR